jgi:uncharacterized coiled-coil DUF342 family protein
MSVKAVREAELLPGDEFQSLEDKIYRTIEQLKAAREAKQQAEAELARVRQQVASQRGEAEALNRELVDLRREREEVRSRVEKMLNQIDSLTAD